MKWICCCLFLSSLLTACQQTDTYPEDTKEWKLDTTKIIKTGISSEMTNEYELSQLFITSKDTLLINGVVARIGDK